MADTVDTEASPSPAEEASEPQDVSPADGAEKQQHRSPSDAVQQQDGAPADGAEEAAGSESAGDETATDKAPEPEHARSVTELFEQLAGELSDLGTSEAQLEAARNLPEVRRSARDIAGALVVVVAALTAFALLNVAAVDGLSRVMASWTAALVVAAFWIGVVGVLLFSLMGRARRWLLWIVGKSPPKTALEELRQERDAAASSARTTLEELGPALALQIAMAAVPKAGDVAGSVIEVGGSVLDGADEVIADITEELPGGGVVNQVWAVALAPGRFGVRVATTVLRRGARPGDGAAPRQ
jgi:hypothetical protein